MENIFTKLTQREKQVALQVLVKDGIELLVKTISGRYIKVKPHALFMSDLLAVNISPSDLSALQNEDYRNPPGVLIFQVKNHRYLLETRFHLRKNGVFLDFSERLYQLQRRKASRLQIPNAFTQTCRIIERNGRRTDLPCHINNISAGGLNLEMDSTYKIQSGESLRFEFQILDTSVLRLGGEVRYVRAGQPSSSFGFAFEPLPKTLENKLLLTIMDIQLKVLYPNKKVI